MLLAASAAVALAITIGGPGTAGAQILPTTTSTTEPEVTTTTAPPELTTTTSSPETTTSAPATTASTVAPRTTTTPPAGPTTTAFVTPTGVPATSTPPPADEVLDADLGKLPLFVGLSLLGFFVAVAIVSIQWVRTRP